MVGNATEKLGNRLGSGATGVLQSALGNLPELFVCIFALRAGLVKVVQAALVGSILANSLLGSASRFWWADFDTARTSSRPGAAHDRDANAPGDCCAGRADACV